MNIKSFYVASLQSALDLQIATPDDILVHTTPDVLSDHLPRALWARLLTACVGAPVVDSQLVVETIGVPNLCEYVPTAITWGCIASIAQRSLGGEAVEPVAYTRASYEGVSETAPNAQSATSSSTSSTSSSYSSSSMASAFPSLSSSGSSGISGSSSDWTTPRTPLSTPPPPEEITREPVPDRLSAVGPSIPSPGSAPSEKSLADIVAELDADERIPAAPSRTRQPTSQRFRQSGTGIGRLATQRRPQASASTAVATEANRTRRSTADGEYEIETDVSSQQAREDWKANLAVEDEQLVDWQASDETITGGDDGFGGRKR